MSDSYEFLRRRAWGTILDRRHEPLGRGPVPLLWVAAVWILAYAWFVFRYVREFMCPLGVFSPLLLMWIAIVFARRARGADRGARGARGEATWARDKSWSMNGEEQSVLDRIANALLGPREVQLLALLLPIVLLSTPLVDAYALRSNRSSMRVLAAFFATIQWPLLAIVLWRVMAAFRAAFAPSLRVTYLERPHGIGRPLTVRFGVSGAGGSLEHVDLQLCCIRETWFPWWGSFRTELTTITRQLPVDARVPEPGSDVDVTFGVLRGGPGTRLATATPTYWELRAKARTSAGTIRAVFLLPVYEVPQPDDDAKLAMDAGATQLDAKEPTDPPE